MFESSNCIMQIVPCKTAFGIDQWRAVIGTFNCHKRVIGCVSFSNNVNSSHYLSVMLYYVVNGASIIILAFLDFLTYFSLPW